MNKHIKLLTDIAIAAAVMLVLTVALLPATAQEPDSEITKESQSSPEEPQEPQEPQDVLTSSSTTTTEPEKNSQTSETTTAEPTAENTSTTTPPPTVQTTEAPKPSWTEQPASGVMYVNTDGISSVEVAQIGSKKMKQYSLNDAVTVVAFTDTDYYKLEDGTFIHADFLSSSEIVITAEGESEPPAAETEDTEDNEETSDSKETADGDVAASDQE